MHSSESEFSLVCPIVDLTWFFTLDRVEKDNISLRDKQFAEAGHMARVNAAHSHSEGKPCTYFYIQYFYFYLLVSDVT